MFRLIQSELKRRKGALMGWALALSFFGTVYILLYPSLPAEVREINPQALALLQSIGMQTFATFEGWLFATEFNVLPVIASLCGLFMGINALAGEEDDGTLELLASQPISRSVLILSKAAALMIALLAAVVVAGLAAVLGFSSLQIETQITAGNLFITILSHWMIGFVMMTFSLFLGAYLPTRNAATITGLGYLLLSFFGENLAGMAPVLDGYRPFFVFSYFKRVVTMLTGEVAWVDMGILLAAGMIFLILAVISFQQRNLTVKAWPWQRPKIG